MLLMLLVLLSEPKGNVKVGKMLAFEVEFEFEFEFELELVVCIAKPYGGCE
jgi:hypothetical protein